MSVSVRETAEIDGVHYALGSNGTSQWLLAQSGTTTASFTYKGAKEISYISEELPKMYKKIAAGQKFSETINGLGTPLGSPAQRSGAGIKQVLNWHGEYISAVIS